jgi:hypothetical protein
MKGKLVSIIQPQVRPTCTTKSVKKRVIGLSTKESLHGNLVGYNTGQSTIDKKSGSEIGFIPKLQRHAGLGKKGEPDLYHVMMFMLHGTILFMSVRA